jgi:hypothetical protein
VFEMKKEQRQVYRDVLDIGGYGLCNACKFAHWYGWSDCESELECDHPLDAINGNHDEMRVDDVWQGADCWGFRPAMSLQECGIIASISHDNHWPHKNKRGEWVAITGIKI